MFILIFAYEIFATSQLLSGLVFEEPTQGSQIFISAIIFLASLLYCGFAGVKAVFRTDQIQLIAILLFTGVMVWIAFQPVSSTSQDLVASGLKMDQQTLINVTLAVVATLSTQFYSLINWFTVSNIKEEKQRKSVLRGSAVLIAIILAIFIALGASIPLDWSGGLSSAVTSLFTPVSEQGVMGKLIMIVIILGLTSIVISTVDTLMISLTMYVHDVIFKRDSKNTDQSKEALAFARTLLLSLFAVAFIFLAGMYYAKPNIFYLLLAIASGAAIYTPLIIAIGYLANKPQQLSVIGNGILLLYLMLVISAMSINLWASASYPALVPYISLIFLVLSVLIIVLTVLKSKSR